MWFSNWLTKFPLHRVCLCENDTFQKWGVMNNEQCLCSACDASSFVQLWCGLRLQGGSRRHCGCPDCGRPCGSNHVVCPLQEAQTLLKRSRQLRATLLKPFPQDLWCRNKLSVTDYVCVFFLMIMCGLVVFSYSRKVLCRNCNVTWRWWRTSSSGNHEMLMKSWNVHSFRFEKHGK